MLQLLTAPRRLGPGDIARTGERPGGLPADERGRLAEVSGGRADVRLEFSVASLRDVRRVVADEAKQAGMSRARRDDLVLAVDELATNSVAHGGGQGTLSVWCDSDSVICEVRDHGHIADALVGLRPPTPEQIGGRGLWIVNRLCDRVQISSSPGRTAVRVQMSVAQRRRMDGLRPFTR